MYHNIERRQGVRTRRPTAAYVGWDASGRLWFVEKTRASRGPLYWVAYLRDDGASVMAPTLRAISDRLATTVRPKAD